jgi:hypothetical protein
MKALRSFNKRILTAALVMVISIANLTSGAPYFSNSKETNKNSRQVFSLISETSSLAPSTDEKIEAARAAYESLPLRFEANQGQTDAQVKFFSRAKAYTLFLTADEALMNFNGQGMEGEPGNTSATLRMKLVDANREAEIEGIGQMPGKVSYFLGDNPKAWKTDVATYSRVKYAQVYRGIDLVYYGAEGGFEYDFNVAPGADFRAIGLDFDGAVKIETAENGDLILHTASGDVRQHKPFAYQEIDGVRKAVACSYLINDSEIRFAVGAYDHNLPLVIDPVVTYATYFGGNANDAGYDITVDASNVAVITGRTTSVNFPGGAIQNKGGQDVFITKIAPSGGASFSAYFGGGGNDVGLSIALGANGDIYIGGTTTSTDFPRIGAYDNTLSGGADGFIVKFNADLNAFLYATYFGGNDFEDHIRIALDPAQNIFITGRTNSSDLQMVNAAQSMPGGQNDAFFAKLNAAGSTVLYSTYLGGTGVENPLGCGLAVDGQGNAYLTGATASLDFTKKNAFQQTKGDGNNPLTDAFVSKLNPNLSGNASLVYSTFIGGASSDSAAAIAVDTVGNAYITGETASDNFPLENPMQATRAGGFDAFVLKLNASGNDVVYATLLGGGSDDSGSGIRVNAANEVYVAGSVGASIQGVNSLKAYMGNSDGFVAKFNAAGSAISFFSYFGGGSDDTGQGVALDAAGNACVVGITKSANFTKVNALQPDFAGGESDAFVARIETDPPATTDPVIATAYVVGKALYIEGINFDIGAKVFLNGEKQKKVQNDASNPTTRIIAIKAGTLIPVGATVAIQVRNNNGVTSQAYIYTRGVQ